MSNDAADVVERNPPDFFPLAFDQKEAPMHMEEHVLAGNIDDPVHGREDSGWRACPQIYRLFTLTSLLSGIATGSVLRTGIEDLADLIDADLAHLYRF
ncbi:MAG: hypothetical protein GX542_09100 [Rhodococcus sp.]|nr:hypothetical protein [Rhodococcus sp. (in: high G+C Gram-positive bacteria)]